MDIRIVLKKAVIILILNFYINIVFAQTVAKVEILNNPVLLQIARNIPNKGILKTEKSDYIYLKVDDRFKTALFPILYQSLKPEDKACLVPNNNPIGEHISLQLSNDVKNHVGQILPNKIYNFSVKNILRFTVDDNAIRTIWYVVEVQSDELMTLQKQLPLHISFAVAKYDQAGKCVCMCDLLHLP